MKQVLIRTEHSELIRGLSFEQRGKLLTLLLNIANDESPQETESILKEFAADLSLLNVLITFKSDIDADKKRYDNIVERNRANGSKGGRPRKNPETQNSQKTLKPRRLQGLSSINHNNNIISEREEERDLLTSNPRWVGHNPPTLEEVISAANQLFISQDNAERFFSFYAGNGWSYINANGMTQPICDWRAKLLDWKNNRKFSTNANTSTIDTNEFHANRRRELAESTIDVLKRQSRGETEAANEMLL